jgi:hypothetical protein
MDAEDTEDTSLEDKEEPGESVAPWNSPEFRNSEEQNIVPFLLKTEEGKKFLEDFAQRIISDKKEDEISCEGYHDRCADAVALYAAMSSTFTYGPAEGERKPCLPILAKIVQRIFSRTLAVINNTEPVAVPTGEEDNDRAIRISAHISWERRAKHPEWKPTMAQGVLLWSLIGSMIRKVYYDPIAGKKVIQTLTPEDVIMPYTDKDTTPQLENVERITEVIYYPKWKIKRFGAVGYFADTEAFFTGEKQANTAKKEPGKVRKVIDELLGTKENSSKKGTQYRFFERHSWEELPGDDMPRHISCIMEESTKKIVRLVIKERENPRDRLRYDNEIHERAIAIDNENGIVGEQTSPEAMQQAQIEVQPPFTEPIYDYIHYIFSPNPEGGIYGFGAWVFVGQLNDIANELAGEDIVAKKIANVAGSSGFVDETLDLQGTVKLKYGEFTKVSSVNGNISGAIWPLPFTPPKADAMAWLELIDRDSQSVMSSSDYQSGMPGPSHETAAAAKLRTAAGSTAITQSIEQFLVPLAIEYKVYARLNAIHLNEIEYFLVTVPNANPNDPNGQSQKKKVMIGRADYTEDFDIVFDSDTRLRVDPALGQSAITAYQLIMTDPDLQGEMNLRMAARKKALKALECPDLANMLPDEVPPPPPPEPMSQEDENVMFMNEKDHPVLPDDNHEDHARVINEFKTNGLYENLSPTGKQIFDRHDRMHQSMIYKMGTDVLEGKPPSVGPRPV